MFKYYLYVAVFFFIIFMAYYIGSFIGDIVIIPFTIALVIFYKIVFMS